MSVFVSIVPLSVQICFPSAAITQVLGRYSHEWFLKGIVSIKTVFPVTPQMLKKVSIMKSTLPSSHAATSLEGRNNRRAETEK